MRSIWFLILVGSLITYHCLTTVAGEAAQPETTATEAGSPPTLEQCKGFVDAALKTTSPSGETEGDAASGEDSGEPPDGATGSTEEKGESTEGDASKEDGDSAEGGADAGDTAEETSAEKDAAAVPASSAEDGASNEDSGEAVGDTTKAASGEGGDSTEGDGDAGSNETGEATAASTEEKGDEDKSAEEGAADTKEEGNASKEGDSGEATAEKDSKEAEAASAEADGSSGDDSGEEGNSAEKDGVEETSAEEGDAAAAAAAATGEDDGTKSDEDDKSADGDTQENTREAAESNSAVPSDVAKQADQPAESGESQEGEASQEDTTSAQDGAVSAEAKDGVKSGEEDGGDSAAAADSGEGKDDGGEKSGAAVASAEDTAGSQEESAEGDSEEEEVAEPYEPRSRDHITQILGLDDSDETKNIFTLLDKVTTSTLKELKTTYEGAVKPLEQMYKYRDLSNRHFGDPEIFSKPLIVFMGPWSGGKSTIINWLLGIQNEDNALRTGADPSPAQFNIMMYGKEEEKLDGTQLAADWTFSGLQKFGQSFLDRLRGQKLPNRLLEKVNIVEIPGILEVRKQVERSFPFNDACQWFIDRADTLFLVYDPAKLDIGPETEAILDQLKGRENQVRIVLNKADTVKPDELLRVQAMLIWNISPLMSSAEPPVMYAASLWDRPLQVESPKSLLVAHENNFLKDIRDGIEKRVETRIAAARRFAVRVRNHAKMVDCYLNTYHNHRSFFSDKKIVSKDIIDHPQNYHIYEGLSTLTNISRYDLPDPDTYRDFFRLNSLWDFPTLQSTCSFWRGCPLHKLDIAIAYDLPEILGKFRRQREAIVHAKKQQNQESSRKN